MQPSNTKFTWQSLMTTTLEKLALKKKSPDGKTQDSYWTADFITNQAQRSYSYLY